LARGDDAKEDVLIVELDISKSSYAKKNEQNPYFADRRPELYEQIFKIIK